MMIVCTICAASNTSSVYNTDCVQTADGRGSRAKVSGAADQQHRQRL